MRDRHHRCLVVFPAGGLGGAGATARPPSKHLHVRLGDRLRLFGNHKPQQFWLVHNKRAWGVKSLDAALSGTGLPSLPSLLIQFFLKVSRLIPRARARKGAYGASLRGAWSKVWSADLVTGTACKTRTSTNQGIRKFAPLGRGHAELAWLVCGTACCRSFHARAKPRQLVDLVLSPQSSTRAMRIRHGLMATVSATAGQQITRLDTK